MWRKLLDRIGTSALGDESPLLAAIVLMAIEAVQQKQSTAPDLRGQLALDDAMRRIGLGVDAVNAMHDGAIDPATVNESLAGKVSNIVDAINAAERASWAFLGDIAPNTPLASVRPLEALTIEPTASRAQPAGISSSPSPGVA